MGTSPSSHMTNERAGGFGWGTPRAVGPTWPLRRYPRGADQWPKAGSGTTAKRNTGVCECLELHMYVGVYYVHACQCLFVTMLCVTLSSVGLSVN